jgi:hypothetical protein
MLPLESFGQDFITETLCNQIFVGCTLAREDCATNINERENYWCVESLVFCLHMIDNTTMFDVGIESGNHLSKGPTVLDDVQKNLDINEDFQTVAQAFFHGQSAFFFVANASEALLDTLDHFD